MPKVRCQPLPLRKAANSAATTCGVSSVVPSSRFIALTASLLMPVRVARGAKWRTSTVLSASSRRNACEKPLIPALLAPYAANPGKPSMPKTEPILMICAAGCCRSSGSKRCVSNIGASRFVSSSVRIVSADWVSKLWKSLTPELLINKFMLPWRAATSMASSVASSVKSPHTNCTDVASSVRRACSGAARRPTRISNSDMGASWRAIAAPMPPLAPVIIAR